jgi:hypothetical protein
MNEDEEFFAWLDGELSGDAADRVAARVAASPELSARAEQHRRLAAGLRGAFATVMDEAAAPPRFQSAEVIDFGARATEREQRRRLFAAPQWAAMAATLLLGIVAGQFIGDRSAAPVERRDGTLVAAASLDRALDTQLANAPADKGSRVGLTFRDGAGNICRSFNENGAGGLACRRGEDWQIRGLFQGAEGQAGDYRMAAGEDPRLAALIDETIAGEPFDATQEQAALAKGWR